MDLTEYVDTIHRQFSAAATAAGDQDSREAEMLFAPLESAFRLALQDCLVAAAEEITCELAPGSVELRLRGREPEFVVSLPPSEPDPDEVVPVSGAASRDGDDGATARINLRLPEQLKAQVDSAAASEGLSTNAWLVRTTSSALASANSGRRPTRRSASGSQRFTGWSR